MYRPQSKVNFIQGKDITRMKGPGKGLIVYKYGNKTVSVYVFKMPKTLVGRMRHQNALALPFFVLCVALFGFCASQTEDRRSAFVGCAR